MVGPSEFTPHTSPSHHCSRINYDCGNREAGARDDGGNDRRKLSGHTRRRRIAFGERCLQEFALGGQTAFSGRCQQLL